MLLWKHIDAGGSSIFWKVLLYCTGVTGPCQGPAFSLLDIMYGKQWVLREKCAPWTHEKVLWSVPGQAHRVWSRFPPSKTWKEAALPSKAGWEGLSRGAYLCPVPLSHSLSLSPKHGRSVPWPFQTRPAGKQAGFRNQAMLFWTAAKWHSLCRRSWNVYSLPSLRQEETLGADL